MNKTPLNALHHRAGGRMVDFAGWEMPLLYAGILDEHVHTRTAASLFDVSHMGRLEFEGADAEGMLQRVCTRNVSKLAVGRCGYAHVCNEQGGILDDVIVSRYPSHWLMVCNASNRSKIVEHIKPLMSHHNVTMTDMTTSTCMIAAQGPRAMALLTDGGLPIELPGDPAALKRYGFVTGSVLGVTFSLFRTGYTGEDGFELVVPAKFGPTVWAYLLKNDGVKPAGLGARDTLRLEAGMPLYGHELDEDVDPISAGCGWCCDLTTAFIGVEALRAVQADGPTRRLVGLNVEGRRIARQGAAILAGDQAVGVVTSGTQSPTLGRVIVMGYVDAAHAAEGTALAVDLRGSTSPATVTALPFYKRAD
jgi:aminomethyltransferase